MTKIMILMICCAGLYSIKIISCSGSANSGGGGSGGSGGTGGSGGGSGSSVDHGTGDVGFSTAAALTACDPTADGYIASFAATGGMLGAEGFGSCTTGGRGGIVVHVTNLNASGAGSLQAALDMNEPRTIVFDVSGSLPHFVYLTYGNVTIAGQTSPGGINIPGILCNNTVGSENNCYNIIIRNLRTRPGTSLDDAASDDGLRLDGAQNIMVDHVSIGNATDEALQISQAANVSVQNTILAETLGSHVDYGGLLFNYSTYFRPLDYISIHHNMWNRIGGRMPEISCEDNENYYSDTGNSDACHTRARNLEISNNYLWDAGYYVTVAGDSANDGDNSDDPIYLNLNFVGNYSKVRSGYLYGMIDLPTPQVSNQISTFFQNNQLSLYPTRSDYQLNYCCDDYAGTSASDFSTPSFARSTRHNFAAITYTAVSALRTYMTTYAGAFPRDAMDQRLMTPVNSDTILETDRNTNPADDARTDCTNSIGNSIPTDTDEDGMPNSWEITKGLDPNTQDHNGHDLNASYTNLEIYLNELMLARLSQTCS